MTGAQGRRPSLFLIDHCFLSSFDNRLTRINSRMEEYFVPDMYPSLELIWECGTTPMDFSVFVSRSDKGEADVL
jgi:hypothetical protein